MIESIVTYLHLFGHNASVKNNRIITNHYYGTNKFVIAGDITPLQIRELPIFYLIERSKYGSLAHVGWDNSSSENEGMICEGIRINRNIDYNNPNAVYKKALENAVGTIIDDLSNDEYNKKEIINEFSAHWKRTTPDEKHKVISFIEPGETIEEIIRYYPGSNSHHRYPFFIKGNAKQINEEYEYLKALMKNPQSKGQAIYIPFHFPLLPPNPTTIIMEWWFEILNKLSPNTQNHLKDFSRRNNTRDFWVLGSTKLIDGSHGWFSINFKNPNKLIPPLFKNADTITWEAVAYDVCVHSKEYIIPRGGSTFYRTEKTIAIIGCGSVGAEIARQIASSGINNLILVDYDKLSIENIYRHFLSSEYLGRSKSIELSLELKKRYPYINATVIANYNLLSNCLTNYFLSNVDGIIIATGSPTEERYYNEELSKLDHKPWVIYCWVEGHGVGGHAIYVHNFGKGCLNCLYRDGDGNKSLESIQNFLKSEQKIAIDIAGCGTHFLPYSFTDAIQTAILATRLALLAVNNKLTESCRMSWKSDNSNEMSLETTYRYSTFKNSLGIEKLYWEYCDVCN